MASWKTAQLRCNRGSPFAPQLTFLHVIQRRFRYLTLLQTCIEITGLSAMAHSQTIQTDRVHRCMLCYDIGSTGVAAHACSRAVQTRTVFSVNKAKHWVGCSHHTWTDRHLLGDPACGNSRGAWSCGAAMARDWAIWLSPILLATR